MISLSYVPSEEIKLITSVSSLKTHQIFMLSGTEGRKINSTKNLSGEKSLGGISLEATFANRSALAFFILDIETILNAETFLLRP
jgi:hypothetical protein